MQNSELLIFICWPVTIYSILQRSCPLILVGYKQENVHLNILISFSFSESQVGHLVGSVPAHHPTHIWCAYVRSSCMDRRQYGNFGKFCYGVSMLPYSEYTFGLYIFNFTALYMHTTVTTHIEHQNMVQSSSDLNMNNVTKLPVFVKLIEQCKITMPYLI